MYFNHANPSFDLHFFFCVRIFGKQQYDSVPKSALDLEYIEVYGFSGPVDKHYLLPLSTTGVEHTHLTRRRVQFVQSFTQPAADWTRPWADPAEATALPDCLS